MRKLVVLLTTLGVLAAAASASAAVRGPGTAGPLGDERLSNERTITRWAHAARRAVVRARPTSKSARVDRLRYFTEDGPPEVYLVLSSRVTAHHTWVHVRIPGRPNGRTGWVPRQALGPLQVVDTHLVVVRGSHAELTKGGKTVWSAPVGTGAPASPTPAGRFYVRTKLRAKGGIYGPWAFGTSAYSVRTDWPGGGVVGVHGTNQPGLIPGRPSNGCIRVRNADISRLARLMPIGTPITIR
jgi:hypothetical protein